MINFEEFAKVELKVVRVLSAENVENSEKLLKLTVSSGEEERQVIAGIGKAYTPESLVGKEVVIVANLEPRMIMGLESQGMIVAATDEAGLPAIVCPDREVPVGTVLK
jgi:methionine--tRNA ligase beta chain